jgi:ribonucleoside-diphosphate reductase beta chain
MENTLKKVPLFNEDGDDKPENQQLINGNPTGISNLNENKFRWSNNLYRIMTGNFWIPEKVSMEDDKISIKNLTPEEDEAVKDTLSFLIFLDSFQCLNLPNIHQYITAPNVANLMIIQQYQEVIHSQSYQYILDSLYPLMTREAIYNRWRNNPILLKRIEYITSLGKAFEADPNIDNFKNVIIANLLLESMYFYQGFTFFDQLASRNKLIQTDKQIDYIRNDEKTHIVLFVHICRELLNIDDHELILSMFKTAVENEIEWAHYIYGDKILGISKSSSELYVKYRANDVLGMIGLSPLYPEVTKNPYAHLEGKKRENFFEAGAVTSYDRSESVSGWDNF